MVCGGGLLFLEVRVMKTAKNRTPSLILLLAVSVFAPSCKV